MRVLLISEPNSTPGYTDQCGVQRLPREGNRRQSQQQFRIWPQLLSHKASKPSDLDGHVPYATAYRCGQGDRSVGKTRQRSAERFLYSCARHRARDHYTLRHESSNFEWRDKTCRVQRSGKQNQNNCARISRFMFVNSST